MGKPFRKDHSAFAYPTSPVLSNVLSTLAYHVHVLLSVAPPSHDMVFCCTPLQPLTRYPRTLVLIFHVPGCPGLRMKDFQP